MPLDPVPVKLERFTSYSSWMYPPSEIVGVTLSSVPAST